MRKTAGGSSSLPALPRAVGVAAARRADGDLAGCVFSAREKSGERDVNLLGGGQVAAGGA
jgi:hypothetical protein